MATSSRRSRSRSSLGTLRCHVPGSADSNTTLLMAPMTATMATAQHSDSVSRIQSPVDGRRTTHLRKRTRATSGTTHVRMNRTDAATGRPARASANPASLSATSARGNPMTSASAYRHCAWTRFSSSLMRSPRREQRRAQSILCRALRFASPRRSRRARARAHRPAASRGWMSCRQTRSLAPPSRYRPRGRR